MTAATEDGVADGDALTEPEFGDGDAAESESPVTDDQPVSLGLDEVFEILKNERRRMVLEYLEDHDEPVSLGDLAEHVAAVENDTTVARVTSKQRKCSYVGLYQCHLPKMDDMDIIEFNQNRGRVTSGPNADAVREYLRTSGDSERSWPVYYGTLATAGVAMIGVLYLLTGPTPVGLGVSAVLLVAIAALATFQLRIESSGGRSK